MRMVSTPYASSRELYLISVDTVAPIEREIRNLANGLTAVKDEQEYIVIRERRHRNTAESTNSRVKWWSIFQAIVLVSVVVWQVYYLKARRPFRHQLCVFISATSRSSKSSVHSDVDMALDNFGVHCRSSDESYTYMPPRGVTLRDSAQRAPVEIQSGVNTQHRHVDAAILLYLHTMTCPQSKRAVCCEAALIR